MTSRCSPSVLSWCTAHILYIQGGSKIEKVQGHPLSYGEHESSLGYRNLLIYILSLMHIPAMSIIYNPRSTRATLWVTAQTELQSKTLSQKTPHPYPLIPDPHIKWPKDSEMALLGGPPLLRESMASCFPLLKGGRGKRIMCYFKHCTFYSSREVSLLLFFQLTPNPVMNLFS